MSAGTVNMYTTCAANLCKHLEVLFCAMFTLHVVVELCNVLYTISATLELKGEVPHIGFKSEPQVKHKYAGTAHSCVCSV